MVVIIVRDNISPLPTCVFTIGEKQNYDELVNTISTIGGITNTKIIQWVPEDSVKVIY